MQRRFRRKALALVTIYKLLRDSKSALKSTSAMRLSVIPATSGRTLAISVLFYVLLRKYSVLLTRVGFSTLAVIWYIDR